MKIENPDEPGARESIALEKRLLERLRRDDGKASNVVVLFGDELFQGRIGIVLECLAITLARVLERRMPMNESVCCHDLLCAVCFIHERDIVHRDLSVTNIMFTHTGILKIIDFGMASVGCAPQTRENRIVQTIWYRCPELVFHEYTDDGPPPHYGSEIDIWSIGCLIHQIVTKRVLFPCDTTNALRAKISTSMNLTKHALAQMVSGAKAVSNENVRGDAPPPEVEEERTCCVTNSHPSTRKLLCVPPSKRVTATQALELFPRKASSIFPPRKRDRE